MRINAINSAYCTNYANSNNTNLNFKNLIKSNSALTVLEGISKEDAQELKQIEKRMSKTKFWDMKISSASNTFKELCFDFIHKKRMPGKITDGIYPYDRIGNKIKFYAIVYGPENSSFNSVDTLEFKTEERAKELYDKYKQNNMYIINREYNITPIESIKMKEVILNMLEEAEEYTKKGHAVTIVNTNIRTKNSTGNDFSYKKD